MAGFRKSLKCKLIFLVILGLVPLVLLTLFNNLELRKKAVVRAQEKALVVADHFQKHFNFVVEETRQVSEGPGRGTEYQGIGRQVLFISFQSRSF